MRFRTLALAVALALGCGAVGTIEAASKPKMSKRAKEFQKKNKQKGKLSKAAQVKPRNNPHPKNAKLKAPKPPQGRKAKRK